MCIAAQADLSQILCVLHMTGTIKYLGLPSMVGRNKAIFAYVKNIIWMRINSWRGRALSNVGKDVMIKYVLQAIPSYIMSIYVLHNSIVHYVDGMEEEIIEGLNGWCGSAQIVLKNLEEQYFFNFKPYDLAMVAKQGCNFIINLDSLVAIKLLRHLFLVMFKKIGWCGRRKLKQW